MAAASTLALEISRPLPGDFGITSNFLSTSPVDAADNAQVQQLECQLNEMMARAMEIECLARELQEASHGEANEEVRNACAQARDLRTLVTTNRIELNNAPTNPHTGCKRISATQLSVITQILSRCTAEASREVTMLSTAIAIAKEHEAEAAKINQCKAELKPTVIKVVDRVQQVGIAGTLPVLGVGTFETLGWKARAESTISEVRHVAGNLWNSGRAMVAELAENAAQNPVVQKARELASGVVGKAKEWGSSAMDQAKALRDTAITATLDFVEEAKDGTKRVTKAAVAKVKEVGETYVVNAAHAVADGAKRGYNAVVNATDKAMAYAREGVSSARAYVSNLLPFGKKETAVAEAKPEPQPAPKPEVAPTSTMSRALTQAKSAVVAMVPMAIASPTMADLLSLQAPLLPKLSVGLSRLPAFN